MSALAPDKRQILDRLALALGSVLGELQEQHGDAHCILATRVVVEAAHAAGLRAEAWPVHVEVYNRAFTEMLDRGESPAAIEQNPAAWSSQLGFTGAPQDPDRLDLHLVAVIEDAVLIDPTLDQCRAPEHGVELPHGFFERLPSAFTEGERTLSYTVNGCAVIYQAHPEGTQYLDTEDWTDQSRWGPLAESAHKKIEMIGRLVGLGVLELE